MKCANSLGNVNFNDLCIHLGLKFLPNFKCVDFEKYDGRRCLFSSRAAWC